MNDEIKEILQLIGNCCYYGSISEDKCKKYCNYITNLQEENEHLDKVNCHLRKKINNDIYKSRNKKATEKLKTLIPICIMPNNTLIHGTEKAKTIEEALNILQGSDDND